MAWFMCGTGKSHLADDYTVVLTLLTGFEHATTVMYDIRHPKAHGTWSSICGAGSKITRDRTLKAILTDIHFWIPVLVLTLGIVLLVYMR